MKLDDQEFNYKQNKNRNDELSKKLKEIAREDEIIRYVILFAVLCCLAFIAWSF